MIGLNCSPFCRGYGQTESGFGYGNQVPKGSSAGLGACGRVGLVSKSMAPLVIFKVNEVGELIRDGKGRCIECSYDEPGEMLNPLSVARPFLGVCGKTVSLAVIVLCFC